MVTVANGEPIKVGMYGTFSGPIGDLIGKANRNGVILATEEINASGGVLGRKIELVERDDQVNPAVATAAVKEMIENQKVVAVLGPSLTAMAELTTGLTNAKGIPHIVNGALGNRVNELFGDYPENYIFRIGLGETLQATAMVQLAVEFKKFNKVALIHDASAHGQGGKKRVERAMELRGKKLVSVGVVNPKELDYTAQVKAAKDAGAEAVLVFTLGGEALKIKKAMDAMNWKPEYIGSHAVLGARFSKTMEGTWGPTAFISEQPTTETARRFLPTYQQRFAEKNVGGIGMAAYGYDSMKLLAMAIQQAGTTEARKVKDALENLKAPYEGATGKYVKPWSPNDHEAVKRKMLIWGIVKDGLVIPQDVK